MLCCHRSWSVNGIFGKLNSSLKSIQGCNLPRHGQAILGDIDDDHDPSPLHPHCHRIQDRMFREPISRAVVIVPKIANLSLNSWMGRPLMLSSSHTKVSINRVKCVIIDHHHHSHPFYYLTHFWLWLILCHEMTFSLPNCTYSHPTPNIHILHFLSSWMF